MNAACDAGLRPADGTPATTTTADGRATRRLWLGGLLLAAVLVRGWNLGAVGLEHFDEGVYAFSGMWILGVPFYTGQHFYAPPLLPGFIGVAYWLQGGVSDLAAIAVSVVAGSVTVILVWWVGRRWYGAAAGLAAACLAALSDMHILYSRMALTDVLLTMWFVLALGCLREALRQGSYRWAVAGGVATALAWNTKYNGWLVLVIALVPLAWSAARSLGGRAPLPRRAIGCWLVAAGVAMAGYLPWLIYVQRQPGGYLELIQHHHGYVVGWSGWPASFTQQAVHLAACDGALSRWALPLAVFAASCCGIVPWRRHGWVVGLLALVALAVALRFSGIAMALVLAGMFALGQGVSAWNRWRSSAQPDGLPDASAGLHGAWFLVLVLLTPFYSPYARLVLPWLPAVWLAAGAAIAQLVPHAVKSVRSSVTTEARLSRALLVFAALAAVASLWIGVPAGATRRVWQRSDDYRTAARQIARRIPDEGRVLVYAEPPTLFYLLVGSKGTPGRHAQPLASPSSLADWVVQPGTATFLVVGPHRYQDSAGRALLEGAVVDRLRLVESFALDRTESRWLGGPEALPLDAEARFALYEVLPRRH